MTASTPDTELLKELQYALRNLYQPAELRKSPFVERFGIDPQVDAMVELRKILLEGIQNLKPQGRVVPSSKAWKIYTVLSHRFVEQFSQKQVASDLAISIRQLRRLEVMALEALIDVLSTRMVASPMQPPTSGGEAPAAPLEQAGTTGSPYAEQELEWLRHSMPGETTDLQALLDSSLRTVMPLFKANLVTLDPLPPVPTLLVSGSLTILRQVLVNILTMAGQVAPGGRVKMTLEPRNDQVLLLVSAAGDKDLQTVPSNLEEMIQMADHLVKVCGGTLELKWPNPPGKTVEVVVSLPEVSGYSVLVVDDNQDALQLIQRYLAGSHYRFVGTTNPHQAIALAEETHPQVIILDVMLPEVDGWELLGRLREHPDLQNAAIVVSTILPQETLAMTLGASAFLRKPFSQIDLLTLLDRFVHPAGKELR